MSSMTHITHIVIHYSATYSDLDIGVAEIDAMHRKRGWSGVGYHYVIRRNGKVEKGRPDHVVGAHVGGQNSGKLGICWIGGLERDTGANVGTDNRTPAQKEALIKLVKALLEKHPRAQVVGHRDLAATQCPAFDVKSWWRKVNHQTISSSLPATTRHVNEGDVIPKPKEGLPLRRSRTMWGAGMSTAGTVGTVISDTGAQIESLTTYSQALTFLFILLTLVGLGFITYSRLDDAGLITKRKKT